MIIPVYKPLGASTHQLAKKCGKLHGAKATHTGTLDPMAEGVVVVLTGEDRFEKQKHSNTKKSYEFEILFDIATDSHDLLGLVTDISDTADSALKSALEKALSKFHGKQKQRLPNFSAKRIAGKSYFDAAKKEEPTPAIHESIAVFALELNQFRSISTNQLQQQIIDKISLVEGDFRQNEIITSWREFFSTTVHKKFFLAKCTAITSKRTYIRGLVRDISQELAIPATTYSIVRTANGPYTLADCICLI